MLSKDPVKRGLNPYRYCDNDPVNYVDPTGEIANILIGGGLGGTFGFAGGFLSSAISQALGGEKVDWKKALGLGVDAGGMSGITRGAVSPYGMQRDPRRGCGSVSSFTTSIGYSSAKGYQYSVPETENVSRSRKKGFSLKDFALQTIMGGVIGGVASAGFYGAGKGIEKLKESFRAGKGGRETELFLPEEYYQKLDDNIAKAIEVRDAQVTGIQSLSKTKQSDIATVVAGVNIRTGETYVGVKNTRNYKGNATCAEDIVFRGLGGNTNANIIMTPAVRLRDNEVIPVCTRCQSKYPVNQFVKGTYTSSDVYNNVVHEGNLREMSHGQMLQMFSEIILCFIDSADVSMTQLTVPKNKCKSYNYYEPHMFIISVKNKHVAEKISVYESITIKH